MLIPLVTLLIPGGSSTLAALGLGIIVAFFVVLSLMILYETPASEMNEGRRLA
ncbi:hypothetical protein [Sodalis sp.]|uniref:hypothetical protein n=1 Tax=Sodalis sp. (in: enterobacteria) TaxID=1898979 RepID=UPI003872D596